MDFFEAQDRAKQATWKLLVLYCAAVILIIISVYVVTLLLISYAGGGMGQPWNPVLFFLVTTFTLILIVSGTLFRIAQLRKGGSAVAEMLGGRKVNSSSKDPNERQLVNIVEEMSIASGLPLPDIYLLDREENINAFAAGFGTDDAAVGVTKGAIEQLNRDELQGVIAHEFSHIFNGDMRLNIRLIGILNGILLIHIMGMLLMRSTFFMGGSRRSTSGDSDSGKSKLVILLLGVALIVIGYVGMLFGRMIQAAVSRQREYLADAAAVQYTRNPDGIAGALEKIGRLKKGAEIKDGHSMEFSHMFFANSFHTALDKLFATHPPLDKRIQAIQPGRDSSHIKQKERIDKRLKKNRMEKGSVQETAGASAGPLSETLPLQEILMGAIGTMNERSVKQASHILKEIPEELREAAHEPFQSEALIYALLLTSNNRSLKEVPEWSKKILTDDLEKHVSSLLAKLSNGKREWALPLAEISVPALRQMSASQYGLFRQNLRNIIDHDDEVTLFEYSIEKLIEHRLDQHFKEEKTPKIKHHHLKPLGRELSIILSSLANTSDTDKRQAFQTGVEVLEEAAPDNLKYLQEDEYTFKDIDEALKGFSLSANPVKRYLMKSMIHCVMADDSLSLDELELLRAMAEVIGSPIPLHVRPTG
ncbi:M48 family metallopeptidase [Rhodohalobacter sp. 8-1]|uniref:M48 family metallopeptidase n=1 Tax=Rhodohalobacter sp. 8-1 TaxID=3131972 RepID=UPI0030EE74AF